MKYLKHLFCNLIIVSSVTSFEYKLVCLTHKENLT